MNLSRCSIVLAILASTGCGASYNVAEVSGTVALDGQPLANAKVVFSPVGTEANPEPGPFSTGVTDSAGKFQLILRDGKTQGAVIGHHRVGITISEISDAEIQSRIDDAIRFAKKKGKLNELTEADLQIIREQALSNRKQLPGIYNENSNLQFEVKNQVNVADFDLKSETENR